MHFDPICGKLSCTELKSNSKGTKHQFRFNDSERGTMATMGEVNRRSVCTVREREQIMVI
jgi:hypothetical protein